MSSYKLSIISPTGKIFDDQVDFLQAPGTSGHFGVLNHHTPFVTTLKSGVLEIHKDNSKRKFSISTGILEVDQTHRVLVLADNVQEIL